MKKPSPQSKIRDLKSDIDCLDKEARSLGERLAQAEIVIANTRGELSVANRKLADAAAESRQWQARFDQLLAAISKR